MDYIPIFNDLIIIYLFPSLSLSDNLLFKFILLIGFKFPFIINKYDTKFFLQLYKL